MDRDIAVFNRPVVEKIQKKNHLLHQRRLEQIRNGLSCRPQIFWLEHERRGLNRRKAKIQEQEKKTEIEKQNMLLFNRMSEIYKRDDVHNQPRNGSPLRSIRQSLQTEAIVQENKNLLHRLKNQKSTISNLKLYNERMKNVNLLKFMGKYPNPVAMRGRFTSLAQRIDRSSSDNLSQDSKKSHEVNKHSTQHYQSRRLIHQRAHNKLSNNKSSVSQYKLQPDHTFETKKQNTEKSIELDNKFGIILYQTWNKIVNKPGQIAFIRNYNSYRIHVEYDSPIYGSRVHWIDFSEEQGNRFFSALSYNYQQIIDLLYFDDRKLAVRHKRPKNRLIGENREIETSARNAVGRN